MLSSPGLLDVKLFRYKIKGLIRESLRYALPSSNFDFPSGEPAKFALHHNSVVYHVPITNQNRSVIKDEHAG